MIPAVCKPIDNEITGLESEREDLQRELRDASPDQKPAIVAAIKKVNEQIAAKKHALSRCVKQHTLVTIEDATVPRVLDWSLDGSWRLWDYDPAAADILPGSPAHSGTWSSIHDGHVLVSMPTNAFDDAMYVLDWVPATGAWRLWNYDRNAPDILPTLARQGKWNTIKAGHVLLPITSFPDTSLFVNHVLDWVPATGNWRLWNYSPGSSDILPGNPVQQGKWKTISSGHVLLPMGDEKVLDWVPATGSWRLWNYDPNAADILPGPALKQGQWSTIKSGHVLVRMPDGKILDWVRGQGSWRLWTYNPNAADILPGPAVRQGQWSTIY
jgi:hypothetical protein